MFRTAIAVVVCLLAGAATASAQQAAKEAQLRLLLPYHEAARDIPGLTLQDYNKAIRELAQGRDALPAPAPRRTLPSLPTYSPPPSWPDLSTPTYSPPSSWSAPSLPALPTLPTVTTPRSRTTYDWQSGNTYTTRKRYNGDTNVDGFNALTGSAWNTTVKPNGSMNGTDSDFNPWSYDSRTGTYINYGTGKMCVGEGYARVCF